MHESEKPKWSRSVVSDPQRPHGLQPSRLLHPWDFPGKSTGVGCHCLLWHLPYHVQIIYLSVCSPHKTVSCQRTGAMTPPRAPASAHSTVPYTHYVLSRYLKNEWTCVVWLITSRHRGWEWQTLRDYSSRVRVGSGACVCVCVYAHSHWREGLPHSMNLLPASSRSRFLLRNPYSCRPAFLFQSQGFWLMTHSPATNLSVFE